MQVPVTQITGGTVTVAQAAQNQLLARTLVRTLPHIAVGLLWSVALLCLIGCSIGERTAGDRQALRLLMILVTIGAVFNFLVAAW